MDQTVIINMLLAMRAQIEAMHAEIDAALFALAGPTTDESGGCRHPPEKRITTTVQDGPDRFLCTVCDQEVEVSE